jgi:hypothetical protein
MSCQITPSQPSFHPIWCDYEWPAAVHHIAEHAIEAFHIMVDDKKWQMLHDLFMNSAEKWKRDDPNSNGHSGDIPNSNNAMDTAHINVEKNLL